MSQVGSAPAASAAGTLDVLDGMAVLDWARLVADSLAVHRGAINTLNVFPVPDSDTGTNMAHTMAAAVDFADDLVESIGTTSAAAHADRVASALAKGAVREARGNSGVILSQVLRALGDHAEASGISAEVVSTALSAAVDVASRSLSDPVEGTIITVLRDSAAAARNAENTLPAVCKAAADAACDSLERTPDQLDVLREAGVVDAGGRGLLIVLDSLVKVVTGVTPQRPDFARTPVDLSEYDGGDAAHPGDTESTTDVEHGSGAPEGEVSRFEVMYALRDLESSAGDALRATLRGFGDSVIVASDSSGGADSYWTVHVHTNEIGGAIQAGVDLGKISDIRVEELLGPAGPPASAAFEQGRTVVALASPGPVSDLFEGAGAVTIDANADEAVMVSKLLDVETAEIIVLPNGSLGHSQITAVDAELRARGRHCIILPTQSIVQGLAALAVHDPDSSLSIDGFDMADAATAVRFARLDRAAQRALTLVGPCEVGDVVGVIGYDVAVVESSPAAALSAVIDRLLTLGGEMLTVIAVKDLEAEVEAEVDRLSEDYPDLEIVTYPMGDGDVMAYVGLE